MSADGDGERAKSTMDAAGEDGTTMVEDGDGDRVGLIGRGVGRGEVSNGGGMMMMVSMLISLPSSLFSSVSPSAVAARGCGGCISTRASSIIGDDAHGSRRRMRLARCPMVGVMIATMRSEW